RRRHTRFSRDWSSDVCSSDLDRMPTKPPISASGLLNQRASASPHFIGVFDFETGMMEAYPRRFGECQNVMVAVFSRTGKSDDVLRPVSKSHTKSFSYEGYAF